jgi:Holliday junction DNA helicase RuvA
MIGLLKGTVAWKDMSSLIVDVHGVGYKTAVTASLLSQSAIGDNITVFTHTHVREDVLELYGFADSSDLKLFEHLISVSGVGCKTALGVFSVGSRKDIVEAISGNDVTFFTSVPRLGKKNAQKIIIDLKSKLGDGSEFDFATGGEENGQVIEALQVFGFSIQEARSAILGLNGAGETVEEKVKLALKQMGK